MTYSTVRAATSPELAYLRTSGQWSRLYLAIFKPTSVYTARLSSIPASNDRVVQISFSGGSGTLSDVKKDMTLYAGSTAGAYDLGVARIRKSAIAGTFYVGEESDIPWNTTVSGGIYLTVVNEFDLWARHITTVSDTVFYMDYDVTYTDQNSVFDPIPIMGGHRVLKLTGSTISTQFNFSNSYVLNSTISSYSCSCPTASSSSGMTTSTPTITFNAAGWHPVYLTVTAANGKSYTGVRYVYVYSTSSMPAQVFQLGSCSVDYDTGGWSFDVTMQDDISLANVPERALCILFAEEYYGDTSTSIGQLAGCENIICIGKISEEAISIDSEQSQITLKIQGYQYWFSQVFAFPTGVLLTATAPTNWAEMQSPTVDKVLYRLLRWGCTATTIMDIYLTNDTLLASELTSPSSNLWAQIEEISFSTIQARPGVDRFTRLFVEVEPQLVPVASRTWANVMTLSKDDYQDPVQLQRVVVTPSGAINASGVTVQSSGTGSALFSLSPGHVFKHYGDIEIVDRLLLLNQTLSNQMAGLLHAWHNNQYPSNEFTLSANNRMIDCFPRQRVAWSVAAIDSPRAFTINGYFIPRRVDLNWNAETGFITTSVTLEFETAETTVNYQTGDIPGSGNEDTRNQPKPPSFPPLPDFPILLPIDTVGLPTGAPPQVVLHDTSKGICYTTNFDVTNPNWLTMNSGLTLAQYQAVQWIGVCPNGAIYVAVCDPVGGFLARAPALGGTFVVAALGKPLINIGVNPLVSEEIGFTTWAIGDPNAVFHVGTSSAYTSTPFTSDNFWPGTMNCSRLFNSWVVFRYTYYVKFNAGGTAVVTAGVPPNGVDSSPVSLPGGTTGLVYTVGSSRLGLFASDIASGTNQDTTGNVYLTDVSSGITYRQMDCDPSGRYMMGRGLPGTNKAKSSDYGTTWAVVTTMVPDGVRHGTTYAGMKSGVPTWIHAGATVKYTPDNGTNWENKTNDLTGIAPFPNINQCKVVGLGAYGST